MSSPPRDPSAPRRWRNTPLILLLCLVTALICAGLVWHLRRVQHELVVATARAYAERYAMVLTELRSLYTSEVVSIAARHGLDASHDYRSRDASIPLPATLTILLGERLSAQQNGSHVALYSPYPFPWRKRTLKGFEQEAWRALQRHPDQAYSRVETVEGVSTLRFAMADRMREHCVACHNGHPSSPKRDWKLGELRGVLEVSMPISGANRALDSSLRQTAVVLFAVGALAIMAFATTLVQLRRRADLHQRLSRTDGLTGLANRRALELALEREWRRALREGRWLSLLMVDVDHFKRYNDRYGHPAGDLCLRQVGQALHKACRRPADLACRYGGEEFVVLLPETDLAGARVAAELMLDRVRELGIAHGDNQGQGVVTVSVGLAGCVPTAEGSSAELLQAADRSLYAAKSAGRNRVGPDAGDPARPV